MDREATQSLVILDGGLPALVAAAIESERMLADDGAAALVLPCGTARVAIAEQRAAVQSQARFFRFETVESTIPQLSADLSPGTADTLTLLAAVEAARRYNCRRIVWPVQFHSDHDTLVRNLEPIAGAIDRAQLMGRLAMIEEAGFAGNAGLAIETPLVDLTDGQIADLVVDLDAPAYLAWWWRRLSDPGAELAAEQERRVWLAALRTAGWIRTEATPAATGAIVGEGG